jgi:hypothetical protein
VKKAYETYENTSHFWHKSRLGFVTACSTYVAR